MLFRYFNYLKDNTKEEEFNKILKIAELKAKERLHVGKKTNQNMFIQLCECALEDMYYV